MRQASSDRPTQAPTTRIGLVRNQVNETLYRVTIDNATISAHSTATQTRGARVRVRFDPEKRFWSIEP